MTTTQKTPKPKSLFDTYRQTTKRENRISSTTLPTTKYTPTTTTTSRSVTSTTTKTRTPSTKNPYVGDYYERLSRTTKSPYDWANIGRFTTTASSFNGGSNYLKRSSNYYSASEQHEQVARNSSVSQRRVVTIP